MDCESRNEKEALSLSRIAGRLNAASNAASKESTPSRRKLLSSDRSGETGTIWSRIEIPVIGFFYIRPASRAEMRATLIIGLHQPPRAKAINARSLISGLFCLKARRIVNPHTTAAHPAALSRQ